MHNWKAPGIDRISNFWYKRLTSLHPCFTKLINEVLLEPNKMPLFLTEGKTYIKPKNSETQNPSNYRPITCLPTMYKIITSIITQKIDRHNTENKILTEEQKGCRKNSRGCKEQIIIDSVISKQAEHTQRNLTTCFIDYKKAFDSIPHSWLIKVLDIYKTDPVLTTFLKTTMQSWRTRIYLTPTKKPTIQTEEIKINTGIFQGDSLSALWFCMCLNPLSNTLNNTKYGYTIKKQKNVLHTINHLLYMDDIKLFASGENQMKEILKTVETITNDTGMEFGLNKCKVVHMTRGKLTEEGTHETLNNELVDIMKKDETYKYLGIDQNTSIKHKDIKQQIRHKYTDRLQSLLKSKLNSKNLFKAINTHAIPILTYSFGVIKWTTTDLEEINRLNRTKLTQHRKHHPNACIQRVTLSRKEGGRGLTDVHILHENQIQNLQDFFINHTSELHNAILKADNNYTPLNLSHAQEKERDNRLPIEQKKIEWSQKALHGQHYALLQNPKIDKELSYKWLTSGQLHPETEGFLLSIQDGVVATKNYRKYILKEDMPDDKCRRCGEIRETIEHIISGCKTLAPNEYLERHNISAKIIHQELAIQSKLIHTRKPHYQYTPESIHENEEYKLYWDRTLHTDKTVTSNRPDITLFNKKEQVTYLIDVAIPGDTNIIAKEQEKITKYVLLATEIKEIWKQKKVIIVPIVVSVTGLTSINFLKHLEKIKIPSHIHTIIQKAVILKTANIVRKFLH